MLRFANGLGPDLRTSHRDLLSLPAIPCILGFDPRYQFVHEDDIVGVLEHAVVTTCPGPTTSPATACWVLSEVASLLGARWRRSCRRGGRAWPRARCGRRRADPGGDGPAAALRARAGQPQAQGRRRALRYTTREAVKKFAEDLRVRGLREDGGAPYRYEREVEEFLRYSPSVRRRATARRRMSGS